ncbi:MAG TPA: hypothetical protein VKV74_04985 [Bryobacteraceae bacterium]|jgi:ABC-type transport system involved in cytochrome bd biosynthesis fused ATPase/permease subunit|nr:hypothetical protein [Bryobacteraceae bacterium]
MLKMVALACFTLAPASLLIVAQAPDPAGHSAAPGAMTGMVKSFDPGKSIDVEINGVSRKFDLSKTDTLYNINPEVKPGSNVTIVETTDNTGKKSITIDLAPARKG